MYVGMRSVSSNYDDFRRPVEGAIQPSIAGFGCFQCIFSLARLNNCNQPHKKRQCVSVYLASAHNYFHDFRYPLECAIIKITCTIENHRSLKLRQTRQGTASQHHLTTTTTTITMGQCAHYHNGGSGGRAPTTTTTTITTAAAGVGGLPPPSRRQQRGQGAYHHHHDGGSGVSAPTTTTIITMTAAGAACPTPPPPS